MFNTDKVKAASRISSLREYYRVRGYRIFSPFCNRLDFIATSKASSDGCFDKAIVIVKNNEVKQKRVFNWSVR